MQWIFFDFDGTLVDSFMFNVEIFNKLAKKYNYRTIDESNIEFYRQMHSREFLKFFGLKWYHIWFIAPQYKKLFSENLDKLKLYDGIADLVRILVQSYKLGILSSNSKENIEYVLSKNNILEYFEYIVGTKRLLTKKKALKKIMKKLELQADQIIYVGDEYSDIEAANANGIKAIGVCWGFNNEQILIQSKPWYIAKNIDDLLQILTKNNIICQHQK